MTNSRNKKSCKADPCSSMRQRVIAGRFRAVDKDEYKYRQCSKEKRLEAEQHVLIQSNFPVMTSNLSKTVKLAAKATSSYNPGYSKAVLGVFERRTAAADAAHLLPHLKARSRILDVGCGPGSITIDFAKIAVDGSVTGIDISAESLALAQARIAKTKSDAPDGAASLGAVVFQEADVLEGLPFENDTFDAVYSGQTFVHLLAGKDGPAKSIEVMKEIYRVLKPGGVVATRDVCASHWFPSSHSVLGRDRVLQMMLNARPESGNPPGGEVPSVMQAAGFDRGTMKISASAWVISSAEGKDWFSRAISAWSVAAREKLVKRGVAEGEVDQAKAMVQRWAEDDSSWNVGVQADVLAFK